MEVEYFYRADSRLAAASLSCLFSRGTFPYISWLLNDSVLLPETHADTQFQPVQPHFALANRRHSLVLTMLTSEETGYYRCRVRDSYDDSGPWVESVAVLVRVTGDKIKTWWELKVVSVEQFDTYTLVLDRCGHLWTEPGYLFLLFLLFMLS